MIMADYKEGKVEYKDGVTIIVPAIDEVDAPDLPPTGTFRERLQAAYDKGRLQAQMTGIVKREITVKPPHECDYWKLGASKMEAGRNKTDVRVVLKRICATRNEFKGCGKFLAFDILPEKEARIRLAQIKRNDEERQIK